MITEDELMNRGSIPERHKPRGLDVVLIRLVRPVRFEGMPRKAGAIIEVDENRASQMILYGAGELVE